MHKAFFNSKRTALGIILLLAFSAAFAVIPIASAHEPPWTIPTWAYITTSPNPVGVNQEALVVFWIDKVPYTAVGAYGDRWTFTVDVTRPDGTNETLGPITSDPVGGGYFVYTPTMTGNYTFVAKFPGKTLTGEPVPPPPLTYQQGGEAYINDTYLPSQSAPARLVVQQETIPYFQEAPLPTGYWTRPINAMNRGWNEIAGNWLGGPSPPNNFNSKSAAPGTSHIVWTKPAEMGGIAGNVGDASYYTGSAYEGYWTPPIIIGGRLYYNELSGPRYGFYCVDLRTGEQLWWQNSSGPVQIGSMTPAHISGTDIPWMYPRLSFGQIYDYESPNQHGALAYLWSIYTSPTATTYTYPIMGAGGRVYSNNTYNFTAPAGATVWQMHNAFTGQYICSIANVPSGSMWAAKDGSMLVYEYNPVNGWLALWNSSQALAYPNNNNQHLTAGEAYYWMWRPPVGRTVDGRNGYMWNVSTVPRGGMLNAVSDDIIVGSNGLGAFQYGTNAYSIWALDVKNYKQATLLWQKNNTQPPVVNATVVLGPISPEDGMGTFMLKETMQWYGYNLNTGETAWGPSEAQASMDMYSMRSAGAGRIAYGKLFSAGYAGTLYAYDVKTGDSLWTSPLNTAGTEAPYANWPVGSGAGVSIADHKVFVTTGEHSVTQPIYRDWSIYAFDTETGRNLWNTTGLMGTLAIADGYAVSLDTMDMQIYCYGKGQTATTVSAAPKVATQGSTVLIEGTVTDQSPGKSNGTPAISDNDMTAWMKYIYKQTAMPMDAEGVIVTVNAIDPNGNPADIATTTSDSKGNFAVSWTPTLQGVYTIVATFNGSDSYFSSTEETHIAVTPPSPVTTQTVSPTTPPPTTSPPPVTATPTATASPSPTAFVPPTGGISASTMTYIAIGVAVIVIVAVAAAVILRRNK